MHSLGIKAAKEPQWTKWEYNPETKDLKLDEGGPGDDKAKVLKALHTFFKDKDILFMRNLYGSNSGNRNSGDRNSGDGILNSFCTKRQWMLFDILCSEQEYNAIFKFGWSWFWINKWIDESEMTDDEKKQFPTHRTCGGYLKKVEYKEAFKVAPQSFLDAVKKLKNFDAAKFEKISGLKI